MLMPTKETAAMSSSNKKPLTKAITTLRVATFVAALAAGVIAAPSAFAQAAPHMHSSGQCGTTFGGSCADSN